MRGAFLTSNPIVLSEKAAEYGLQLLHRNNHLEHCKEQLESQIALMRNSYDELKQVTQNQNYLLLSRLPASHSVSVDTQKVFRHNF